MSIFIDHHQTGETYPTSTHATVNTTFNSAIRASKYTTHAFLKLAAEGVEASVCEGCVVRVGAGWRLMVPAKSDNWDVLDA